MKIKYEYTIIMTLFLSNISYAKNVTNDDEKSEKELVELNKQCEIAREKKLKPLREDLVKQCVTEQRNSNDYCTYYYSTYGDAIFHANGTVQPRMFHDLPECLKAFNYSNSNI